MRSWHGTPNEKACAQITRERVLRPLADPYDKYKGSISTPMAGRVYVSKDPNIALLYALGGDYAGHPAPPGISLIRPYGCLFEVEVPGDADIVVDEDELGELAAEGDIAWLSKLGLQVSFDKDHEESGMSLWGAAQYGEYDAWIRLGHLLHQRISSDDMQGLISHATNYAVLGAVRVVHGYRIDKRLSSRMRRGDIESALELSERLF